MFYVFSIVISEVIYTYMLTKNKNELTEYRKNAYIHITWKRSSLYYREFNHKTRLVQCFQPFGRSLSVSRYIWRYRSSVYTGTRHQGFSRVFLAGHFIFRQTLQQCGLRVLFSRFEFFFFSIGKLTEQLDNEFFIRH